MRKRWYLLLCLLTMLFMSPQAALALPSLSIGNVTGVSGQNTSVNMTLAGAGSPSQIGGVNLELAYDPSKLSGDPTVTAGAAMTAAGKSLSDVTVTNLTPTKSTLNFLIFGLNSNTISDGVLLTLTFPLKSDFAGSMPVTFNLPPEVNDPDNNPIEVTASNGSISVADTAAPTVTTFTVTSPLTTKAVPITSLIATDNLGVVGYLVTELSTKPSAGLTTWSQNPPSVYNVGANIAEGTPTNVTLYAWAKDAAGLVSASKSAAVSITLPDVTAPTVTGFTVPGTATSRTIPISSFVVSETTGVSYLVTESTSKPASDATGWSTTKPANYTVNATLQQGIATSVPLYAWAKDAAGNVSSYKSAAVTITLPDTTAPTVTEFTIPATATALAIPISSFVADETTGASYLVTENATKPQAGATGWKTTKPTSYTVTAPVEQAKATPVTLYGWAKDAAGNVSAYKSATVTITLPDTVKPSVGTFTVPATATSRTISGIILNATDLVGVTDYAITESASEPTAGWSTTAPTSYTVVGNVPQGTATIVTLYAWAKDAAGNVSTAKSAPVSITLTGPTLTFTGMLADGTVTKTPDLTVSGSVDGNGTALKTDGLTIQVGTGAIQPVTFDAQTGAFTKVITLANGDNEIVVTATDVNDNVTTDTRTITLNTEIQDFVVTAASGFVKSSLVDVTGTVGSPQTTTKVTIQLNNAQNQNNGTPVEVALNGGNSFVYQLVLEKGLNTIVVTAFDSAGEIPKTFTVTYDPDAPVLKNITAPSKTPKSSVVLAGTVEDTLTAPTLAVKVDDVELPKPVVTDGAFSVTIDLPTVKSYAVTVTATDESGNSSTVTVTIDRNPSGNVTDGISNPTITDVQKVLAFALGLATPSADEVINVDVAPLVAGKPDGLVDGRDALAILEKVIGLRTK